MGYAIFTTPGEGELAGAFATTFLVPAGVTQIPLDIPVSYIPSGTTQQVMLKLLSSNNGVRIGPMSTHRLTIMSPKRTVGFIEKAVRIQQSKLELENVLEISSKLLKKIISKFYDIFTFFTKKMFEIWARSYGIYKTKFLKNLQCFS